MMISMIRIMSVFFLLSLLGSQARMLPGDQGIFKVSSINYYKDKSSSFVVEQVNSIMSNYGKTPRPSPPPPNPAPTKHWISKPPPRGNCRASRSIANC
ncbi:hypothetical protein DCAR_0729422 [Daucus carota subsp. sativus]|uniref:Uncharacterized protein n=1 Tax=Daucus carota subsp. sativus TaxID=79200 RepID=A0A161ZMB2_DAUCS|nr:hypothetical protein DCAR_0729422 [Daucus carota subsp. sativus]